MVGGQGLALSAYPHECTLEPWGEAVIELSCFADMPGDYVDALNVAVGNMDVKKVSGVRCFGLRTPPIVVLVYQGSPGAMSSPSG